MDLAGAAMTYHTYVVTNTVLQEAIVCCARSEDAALRMGVRRWSGRNFEINPSILSALRVAPGTFLDV